MANIILIERWTDGKREVVTVDKTKMDNRDPDRFLTDDEKRAKREAQSRSILRKLWGWITL